MSEWISVEDRLPPSTKSLKNEFEILAYCRNTGKVHQGWFSDTDSGGFWALYPGSATSADVTHWMPLPEPPQ